MIISAHIVAGAAIAAKTQNPVLGIFLAFLSHYVLDLPPHKPEYSVRNIEKRIWKKSYIDFLKAFLDLSAGFAIVYILVGRGLIPYLGGFAAAIPDGLSLLYIIFPNNKLLRLHIDIHNKLNQFPGKIKESLFWGIVTYIVIFGVSIYFLL